MIRILIADDHSIVRMGIKKLFAKDDDIVVAGEAANGEQVLEILGAGGIDLLLLDMTMPGLSGADLISHICLLDSPPLILAQCRINALCHSQRYCAIGVALMQHNEIK